MQRAPHDHVSIYGDTLVLLWEDSAKLSVFSQQQMQDLFVEAFLKQYRISGTMNDLTDEEVEDSLIDYFAAYIQPRFGEGNKYKQYLLCARYIGQICGFVFWDDLGDNQAYAAEVAIAPKYWHQGLGKIFMKSIFYRQPHTNKILLLTNHQNKGAKQFYEAIGYQKSPYMHEGYSSEKFGAYELETDFETSVGS